MYVSVVNCLCILACVATIGCRSVCGSDSASPRPSKHSSKPDNRTVSVSSSSTAIASGRRTAAPASRAPVLPPPPTSQSQAENRSPAFQFVNPKPPDVAIECKALRSKRYITDGFCTSVKPIVDMVCTGNCLPISDLPWYAEFIKVWSRTKTLQYRCVDDSVRYKRVTFTCDSGETRSYKIRVVRSCKCKQYLRNQNESPADRKPSKRSKNQRPKKLSNLSDDPK